MRFFIKSLAWILTGCLLAVFDCILQGAGGSSWLSTPQLLLAFWAPLIVLSERSMFTLEALPSFLILDFYAATPFGAYSLALLGGLYATTALFQKVFSSISALTVFAGVLFCSLLSRLVLYSLVAALVVLKKITFDFNVSVLVFSLAEALATAALSLIAYTIQRYLLHFTPRSKGMPIRI